MTSLFCFAFYWNEWKVKWNETKSNHFTSMLDGQTWLNFLGHFNSVQMHAFTSVLMSLSGKHSTIKLHLFLKCRSFCFYWSISFKNRRNGVYTGPFRNLFAMRILNISFYLHWVLCLSHKDKCAMKLVEVCVYCYKQWWLLFVGAA